MSSLSLLRRLGRTLGSLRLTVWLLAFSVILVFFGTLDQVPWPMGGFFSKIPLPVPGGYLIGPLLAINLVFSHIRHFRFRWNIAPSSILCRDVC